MAIYFYCRTPKEKGRKRNKKNKILDVSIACFLFNLRWKNGSVVVRSFVFHMN